jgi:hypothetical protein
MCDKNWVRYYCNLTGNNLELVLAHFKNDNIKGTQRIPLSKMLMGPFIFLEHAHDYLCLECPSMWFNTRGEMYKPDYWSTICSKVEPSTCLQSSILEATNRLTHHLLCHAGPHPP